MSQKQTILIICRNELSRAPRFLMEVDSLANDYSIIAAGISSKAKESRYTFFQLSGFSKEKRREIVFHLKYPVILRKIISVVLRVLFVKKLNEGKLNFRKDFKLLKKLNYDLIVVHHFSDLALAVKLAKHKNVKLIFNAHEYYPLEHDSSKKWMEEQFPRLIRIGCKNLPKINICFCVGEEIAKKYKSEFGIESTIITNAKPYSLLYPNLVSIKTIKLIHHGLALRNRKIELMIQMMTFFSNEFVLYLILVPGDPDYINELSQMATRFPNVIFIKAVETIKISVEINQFDIGVYLLPPENFNDQFALPNKFFEFIQARLAIAIGPSPEMAAIVNKYDLGIVSEDFTPKALAIKIKELSKEKIMYHKNQSHKYAKELSVEENWKKIHETVDQLIK